jgi:hypothetical protein
VFAIVSEKYIASVSNLKTEAAGSLKKPEPPIIIRKDVAVFSFEMPVTCIPDYTVS